MSPPQTVSMVRWMATALQASRGKWVARLGRIVRATEEAQKLGFPLMHALDRRWVGAVMTVPFSLLPRTVREDLRVVVDVGANRGDWSDALLSLSRPTVMYAFEPNPVVFEVMERRLAPRGVRCIQAAVGANAGVAMLNVEAQPELSSIRVLSTRGRAIHQVGDISRKIEVKLVTLDEELSGLEEISLLKLDVQGYESEVIDGARKVLARTKCLVTEILYEGDYYQDASTCLELARLIESVSPLRLSCISAPALAPDGYGAWADAIFVNPKSVGRSI